MLHPHDLIPAIDIDDLSRDRGSAVAGEPQVTVFEAIATRAVAGRGPRKPLRVVVREAGPVVVVLSALEPVRWQLVVGRDTELCAVLLAGSGESSVADAREAVVKSIGGFYAFRRGHDVAVQRHVGDRLGVEPS